MRRFWIGVALVLCFAAPPTARAEDPAGPPAIPTIASQFPTDTGRVALEGVGLTYGVNYVGEIFEVARGGTSRGTSFNGRVEGYTDVDLEKFAGWQGGTFHANMFYIHGEGATSKRIGNFFAVSNIDALGSVRLFELWIEQALLDDKLTIRFGQLAADSEFFISDTAGQFINGTFGWPGIVAANMTQGGPAYPLATPGARVQFSPNEHLTLLAGVYNGSPADSKAANGELDNRHGLNFRVSDPPLLMFEGHYKYDIGLPGTLKLGGWKQFGEFADQRTGARVDGDHGLYAIVDQQIWNGLGERKGVSVFGRISGSPYRQNLIDFYFDTGIVFTGVVPGRTNDSFGAAFGYGDISSRAREADIDAALPVIRDYEAVLEINYQAEILPGWTVVPDFQYIWHPGGNVEDPARPRVAIEDALVFGLRTTVNY
jgi:porin